MVTEQKWQLLLQAYREAPSNFLNAARMAQCDRATAKKAWGKGWPDAGRKAIQLILMDEERERAEIAKAKAEAVRNEMEAFAASLRGDVRAQALEEYERTNRFLRAASATATGTLVAVNKLVPVLNELGDMAPELVSLVRKELDAGELSATKAIALLDRIGSFTKTVAAAANAATLQGAKVFEVTKARSSMDSIINIDKALSDEPFDPAEAKRLAAELAEAALEVEMVDTEGRQVLKVVAQREEEG